MRPAWHSVCAGCGIRIEVAFLFGQVAGQEVPDTWIHGEVAAAAAGLHESQKRHAPLSGVSVSRSP